MSNNILKYLLGVFIIIIIIFGARYTQKDFYSSVSLNIITKHNNIPPPLPSQPLSPSQPPSQPLLQLSPLQDEPSQLFNYDDRLMKEPSSSP